MIVKQKRVLILGGTQDAVELATRITGLDVITSLAGRTNQPVLPSTHIRIGSFGGVVGLKDYLREQEIDFLIDATHPFAVQISNNAAIAASQVNIPRIMLLRPAWLKIEGDHWLEVINNEAAAQILPGLAERIFLTIGRQELATFAHLKNIWFLMRMIDPPLLDIPSGKILTERGPFSLENERLLLQQYEIGAIVTKNSGGSATYAKIIAARELQIPVVIVQRPSKPPGEKVSDVESVLDWLNRHLS